MTFDVKDFSYGVELEYGNCDRTTNLPDGATWNLKDNTCVSSTGIANDPQGKLYKYGGEINTRPTNTIEAQIEHIQLINEGLDSIVNYRSNLHVHVRVPGLKDNLAAVKKLFQYIITHQQTAFSFIETIPYPEGTHPDKKYLAAIKRMKRNFKSHQSKVPPKRCVDMLAAKTTQEFFENHAPLTPKGRMWFFAPRAGINLRPLWGDTETIEFRHFSGTKDMKEMASAIRWCREFTNIALNGDILDSPIPFMAGFCYNFPRFHPFEYETEMVYQHTNLAKVSRKVVSERLDDLRKKIDIDDLKITSSQIYDVMVQ